MLSSTANPSSQAAQPSSRSRMPLLLVLEAED
jgi:hypothetical protein